jgi:hypothetical protein
VQRSISLDRSMLKGASYSPSSYDEHNEKFVNGRDCKFICFSKQQFRIHHAYLARILTPSPKILDAAHVVGINLASQRNTKLHGTRRPLRHR